MSLLRNATSKSRYEVVVMEEEPFVTANIRDGGKVAYSGFSIELLEKVAKIAGFDYDIRLTQHSSYGYKDMHGKWLGLVSELGGKNAAHMAVGPIPITSEMESPDSNFFALTIPYMSTGTTLLIKNPPEIKQNMSIMLEPFKAEVWVMVCLAFVVVSLALFLIGHFSPFEWARVAKEKDHRHARHSFGLKNSFLFTASTMSLQGYREAPRSTAGRILMCMWFMFSVLVLLAYTGNLCAIFITRGDTAPRRNVPFKSYMDIINDQQIKIGAMKYSAIYPLLRGSKYSPYQDLYRYIDENQEWIQDRKEGVERVSRSAGRYVFLMDTMKAEYVTAKHCDLVTYGENILRFGYGFATLTHWKLRDEINEAILSLRENGDMTQLRKKYFYDASTCSEPGIPLVMGKPVERAQSLDMTDMAIPFLFLFFGILGAAGALGAELYYKYEFLDKKQADQSVREPLNTEAGVSKAPRESPPPPPIYKPNNKQLEQGLDLQESDKATGDSGKGNSIEMVEVDERKTGDEDREEMKCEKLDVSVNIENTDEGGEETTKVVA